MGQLGQDFMGEMIAKNGTKIINNVDTAIKKSKFVQQLESMQSLVFDSVTAALTAKNDLAMFFIQQLANQIIIAIDKKRAITQKLRLKMNELYNILVLITTTKPFFDTYLRQLRQALLRMYEARNDFSLIRNTLVSRDLWLDIRYAQAIDKIKQAEKLMEPESASPTDVKFTDQGLLAGTGVPSQPQQLMLLLALPQKVKEVLSCANGYFVAVAKLNALLLAYILAYGQFTGGVNRKLKQFTVNTMDNLIGMMDELISSMAKQLNGSPSSILQPDTVQVNLLDPQFLANARNQLQSGGNIGVTDSSQALSGQSYTKPFEPNPISTSSSALGWLIDIKVILAYSELVPGPVLKSLNVSNRALELYDDSVKKLKSFGNATEGDSVLFAVDGREEIGQLEKQLSRFLIAAAKGITFVEDAKAVLPLGRTIMRRLDMSYIRDGEIRQVISNFANADLAFPSALKRTGNSVFKMLDKFGLDRASDSLRNGGFADFFNMNSKTATYAGAAIAGFAVLSNCLKTEEAREQITQAKREIEREQKSKELIALRSANAGFQQQIEENRVVETKLDSLKERTTAAARICGVDVSDFAPSSLTKNVGPIVGVGILGNKTLTQDLTKLGKGII
jgi:hypothetical protein